MAKQILTKWIADDQVIDSKILLRNDQWLRARNAADNGNVNLIGVNLLDEVISYGDFIPRSGVDIVTSNYVDNTLVTPSATDILLTLDATYTGQDAFGSLEVATQFESTYDGDVQQVFLFLDDVGTPAGDLVVNIYSDSAGEPGTILGTSDPVSRGSISAPGLYQFTFSTPVVVLAGTMYWASLAGDSAYNTAEATTAIGRRDADFGTYPVKWFDGTDWQDPIDSYSIRFQIYGDQQIPAFLSLGKSTAPWENSFVRNEHVDNEIRFRDADQSNYVGFKAPATVASDQIWILPDADGTAGQALVTDGAGELSWQTVATAPGGTNTAVQFNNSGAFGGNSSQFSWDNSNFRLGLGTGSPGYPLHVVTGIGGYSAYINNTGGGSLLGLEANSGEIVVLGAQSGTSVVGTQTAHSFYLRSNSVNRIELSSGGDINLNSANVIWSSGVAGVLRTADSGAGTQNLIVRAGDAGGSGTAGTIVVRSGGNSGSQNTGDATFQSGNHSGIGSGRSGHVLIASGNGGASGSGNITLQSGSITGGARGKVKLVDGTEGTIGHVWTQTAADGTGSWQAASGGANTALSNLITTSINQNLLPDSSDTRSLGSSGSRWSSIFVDSGSGFGLRMYQGIIEYGQARANVTTPSGASGMAGLIGISPNASTAYPIALMTANNSGANAVATGTVYIESGNKTAGTGNSGDIQIRVGTSTGGARGAIKLIDGSEGTVGHVWTQTNADGSGEWQPAPGAGGGEPEVEYRTITGGEASAEALTLAGAPATPAKVMLDVLDGGGTQEYGVEYTVTGTTLDWSAGPLSGVLTAGDRLRIVYWL